MSIGNWGNQQDDIERARGQVEYAKEKVKELGERKSGEKYPLVGATIGIIIGAIIGFRVWNWNAIWLIGCVIAGGIIGTLLGSLVGALVARYLKSKANHTY